MADEDHLDPELAARALGRPVELTDADGFRDTVDAGALHPVTGWVAWLGCRQKQVGGYLDISFRLRLKADGHPGVEWEPVTYNPYFGCDPRHLAWHGDAVLFVYEEKHSTYAAWAALDGAVRCEEVSRDFLVAGDRITYRHRYDDPVTVSVRLLPGLDEAPPMTADDARAAGLLPPRFDADNESHRRYLERFPPRPAGG